MLNKSDIISIMEKFPYDRGHFWISTGAALVLHGVKSETRDIDIGCDEELFQKLIDDGCETSVFPDGGVKVSYGQYIEVYKNWSVGQVENICSLPVLSLQSIISIKTFLGREKDLNDIALIKDFLNKAPDMRNDQ